MHYGNTLTGIFIERPNRFIASVEINGKVEKCHVKNTGRCKELLIKGVKVVLSISDNPERKTKYDIIAVYKGKRLINIDSQIPNRVVKESLPRIGLIDRLKTIRSETVHGDSRFDFFAEGKKKCFIEVKGVTLEKNGIALFPDAPTERGLKHVKGLIECVKEGYEAYIFFLIQMKDVRYFTPNYETHPEFGEALIEAEKNGVHIVAYDCEVTESSIELRNSVKIILTRNGLSS